MTAPQFNMRQLLEAGIHFGHQTHRWNPKMKPYIFGDRNNVHIIDLAQTVPLLSRALQVVSDTVAGGGRVLFVGTKRQASDIIADAAKRSAQYYVNARWLGGMLTNWKTISNSIQRLRKLDEILNSEGSGYSKKERLTLEREREKLEKALGGIRDMGGVPGPPVRHRHQQGIASRSRKPSKSRHPGRRRRRHQLRSGPASISRSPATTTPARAIALYCDLIARAAIDGIERQQGCIGP
jgi:small subunit ribosomal protein S2